MCVISSFFSAWPEIAPVSLMWDVLYFFMHALHPVTVACGHIRQTYLLGMTTLVRPGAKPNEKLNKR